MTTYFRYITRERIHGLVSRAVRAITDDCLVVQIRIRAASDYHVDPFVARVVEVDEKSATQGIAVEGEGADSVLVYTTRVCHAYLGLRREHRRATGLALAQFNQARLDAFNASVSEVEASPACVPAPIAGLPASDRYVSVWVSSRLATEVPVDRKVHCHLSPIPPELTAPVGTMGCRKQRNRTRLAEEVCDA